MPENKLKILYISHLHPPRYQPLESVGGMQNVSLQLVSALDKRQDVKTECLILHSSWKYIGIKTFYFLLSLLWKLPAKSREFEPDIILFSSMVTAGVLPFIKWRLKVPAVTINHGQDVTLPVWAYQKYVPTIFKCLDGVISVSSATREASIRRGLAPEKGVALPNGFDTDVQNELPEKRKAIEQLEKEFGVALKNKKIILTVGRQVKRKGHEWFIRHVLERMKSDVVFIIAGDGPERNNIEAAREESAEKENIIIAGKIPEELLNACYSAADLFVMPNIPVKGDMEGFGIVILEANRAGVPVISADLEGMRDVVRQGVNGYRVPHSNSKVFAEKIDYVLMNGLQELSADAREYVLENFSWNIVADRYVRFLREVAE